MIRRLRTDPVSRRVALTVGFAAFVPAVALAQQDLDPEQISELMARSLELAQPGPEHERLAALAGPWDMTMTMWAQPGADP